MAVDFSKFESMTDLGELQKDVANAPDQQQYEDVPNGTYICGVENMEIKETKDGKKLMFALCLKVKEGDHKNRLMFFNRVITGNTSPKWTDAMAIKSVITFVNKFVAEGEAPVEFVNFADFADQILDVFQVVKDNVEVEIDWDAEAFNPIKIVEVFDI